jgi:hypothetical protein
MTGSLSDGSRGIIMGQLSFERSAAEQTIAGQAPPYANKIKRQPSWLPFCLTKFELVNREENF